MSIDILLIGIILMLAALIILILRIKETPISIKILSFLCITIELLGFFMIIWLIDSFSDIDEAQQAMASVPTSLFFIVFSIIGFIGILYLRMWGVYLVIINTIVRSFILFLIEDWGRSFLVQYNYLPLLYHGAIIGILIYNWNIFKNKKN